MIEKRDIKFLRESGNATEAPVLLTLILLPV